jgi:hypothetical protein
MANSKNTRAAATAAAAAAAPASHSIKTGTTKSGLIFKKTKTVTVPVLKLMPDVPVYVKVEGKMEISKQVAGTKVAGQAMEPATIMHCTNLDGDSECLLIVGKMLKSVIEESYPDNSYVGKCFEIVNHGKRGDKKYNAYSLCEVEVE